MFRTCLALALIALLAAQLVGGAPFPTICLDQCPDEAEETSCPPVCALCTSCAQSQTAAVRAEAGAPLPTAARTVPVAEGSASPAPLPDEIFHVPLAA